MKLYATNKQNSSTFPRDILNLLFSRTLGCRGMPDQTQQALHDLTKTCMQFSQNHIAKYGASFKGCVRYIFASLSSISKREHL